MIKLASIIKEIIETYYDNMSDDEKTDLASSYFNIGHDGEDGEEPDSHYCWMWNGNDVVYKKGGNHPCNFGHRVAEATFKGWFDTNKNIISVVFPSRELEKLGDRKPTEDDIPQYLYSKLISKFGKRKPKFAVFENTKTLDEDYAHRTNIVVGIIFKDGEIKSKETTLNHQDIGMGSAYGKRWRYNPISKVTYWWFPWNEKEKELVTEHLKHEYNYNVRGNICLSYVEKHDSKNYFKYFNDAHGNIQ